MLLELKNIYKKFDTPTGQTAITVLNDLSFSMNEGETVSIVGPSGSGKSTLLNIMGTLDQPTSGDLFFNDRNMLQCSANELAEIRNREIGFIFQLHYLLQQCTVIENVLIPTLAQKIKTKANAYHERATELLNKVGLEKRLDYFPAQLSGGELQRVAVVRALINSPKLVLADEPTGSLDNKSSLALADLLRHLDEKLSLVVVTHSVEIASMMDKQYYLQDGRLVLGT